MKIFFLHGILGLSYYNPYAGFEFIGFILMILMIVLIIRLRKKQKNKNSSINKPENQFQQ